MSTPPTSRSCEPLRLGDLVERVGGALIGELGTRWRSWCARRSGAAGPAPARAAGAAGGRRLAGVEDRPGRRDEGGAGAPSTEAAEALLGVDAFEAARLAALRTVRAIAYVLICELF